MKAGLQRDRFLPFIALLGRSGSTWVELDSGRDYRLARMRGRKIYHWPLDARPRMRATRSRHLPS
jgi:cell division protein ZapE